jgi:hypothetical protein
LICHEPIIAPTLGGGGYPNTPRTYSQTGHQYAMQLREYPRRRGVEHFHQQPAQSLPGRAIVELSNSDPIVHTVYDLEERFRMPGAQYFDTGRALAYRIAVNCFIYDLTH